MPSSPVWTREGEELQAHITIEPEDDVTLDAEVSEGSWESFARITRSGSRMRVRPLNGWNLKWAPDGSLLCEPPSEEVA
jgi:hypothetical protein